MALVKIESANDPYTERRRYYWPLIQEGHKIFANNPQEEIRLSLNDYVNRYNMKMTAPLYSHHLISDMPQLTGYKLVRITNHGELMHDTFALLELGLWKVCDSNGNRVRAINMKSGEKYCSDSAITIKSWIIGPHEKTQAIVDSCISGDTKFVSNFDPSVVYDFDKKITIPDFGEPGEGCVRGIHFFIDKKSAFNYIKSGYIGVSRARLITTGSISSEDIADQIDALTNGNTLKRYEEQKKIAKQTMMSALADVKSANNLELFTSLLTDNSHRRPELEDDKKDERSAIPDSKDSFPRISVLDDPTICYVFEKLEQITCRLDQEQIVDIARRCFQDYHSLNNSLISSAD